VNARCKKGGPQCEAFAEIMANGHVCKALKMGPFLSSSIIFFLE